MIQFENGLSIGGNPKIIKTDFGVRITNNLGLNLELSNTIWDAFNQKNN